MKNRKRVPALALAVLVMSVASMALAAAPKTKAECLAMAEKYEKMAADQEAVVQEHTQMKKDYRAKFFLPKQEREKALADMDTHCDALIAAAQKLADEYKAIAQWHKMHAEHMKE